jgi:phage baseplate assembly protein W
MATLMEQFQKNVIGSRGEISDYIPTISSKGDFTRVTGLSAILASWNNILLTPLRTYNYNPEYGSNLYKYAFEPGDDITKEAIVNEIIDRLMTYDDRAKVTNIEIQFMTDGHGFIVNIGLLYLGEEGRLVVNIDGRRYLQFL